MTKARPLSDSPLMAGSDLGRLYDLASGDAALLHGEDLGMALAAQLDLPAPTGIGGAARTGTTLRALLRDGAAPASSFVRLKTEAKAWEDGAEPELAGVAHAVYLGAIAAALVHHGRMITRLARAGLKRRPAWLLAQQWVDPELRALARDARRKLEDKGAERPAGGG